MYMNWFKVQYHAFTSILVSSYLQIMFIYSTSIVFWYKSAKFSRIGSHLYLYLSRCIIGSCLATVNWWFVYIYLRQLSFNLKPIIKVRWNWTEILRLYFVILHNFLPISQFIVWYKLYPLRKNIFTVIFLRSYIIFILWM